MRQGSGAAHSAPGPFASSPITVRRGPFAKWGNRVILRNLPVSPGVPRGANSLCFFAGDWGTCLPAQLPECAQLCWSRSGKPHRPPAELCPSCTCRNKPPKQCSSKGGRSPFVHPVRRYVSVSLRSERVAPFRCSYSIIQKKKAHVSDPWAFRETLPLSRNHYVSAFSPTVFMPVHIHMGMLCAVRENSPFV